ncbi:septation protein SpoVG family protein [Elusimicrobiota bacterium]
MIFKKVFFTLVIILLNLFFIYSYAHCQKVSITNIEIGDIDDPNSAYQKLAEVTINNSLIIKEIKFITIKNNILLEFPEYISKNSKVYPQIKLLDKNTINIFRTSILNKEISKNIYNNLSYKLVKFSKYSGKSKIKVFVSLIFNDSIQIECKIIDGKNGPWVAWPSRKLEKSEKWIKQVIITNKNLKKSIETDLINRYNKMIEYEKIES